MPSGARWSRKTSPMRSVVASRCAASVGDIAQRSGAWIRGTTSVWPRVAGTSGKNTTVWSSSKIIRAGPQPTAMEQNGHGCMDVLAFVIRSSSTQSPATTLAEGTNKEG